MDMFAKIAKKGLTFSTTRGPMTVSQIWKMPLTGNGDFNLTTVSRDLLAKTRSAQEENLVDTGSNVNSDDELRVEVLKFIIADIKETEAKKLKAKEQRLLQQKIAEVVERKKDSALESKSLDELQAMLESMSTDE